MIRFNSDYTEGCHPAILERLAATNMEQTPGYGEDAYCAAAAEQIKEACAAPEARCFSGGRNTDECDSDFGCIKTLSGCDHCGDRTHQRT